ncbi:MAG TPA: PVC-type heme-binding CxxCH protein [Tepidisphaeraceae bacterium]|nr:PVC-type heme-binding CxxCH protein [Tepidisphaeraceae bacterium]
MPRSATTLTVALVLILHSLAPAVLAQRRTAEDHAADAKAQQAGILPVGDDGKPLNTDFEAGDLRDWTASAEAFTGQPIKGDTINVRRGDMRSRHAGNFWIGTYEVNQDGPRGILTSKPFKVTHPWAMFLVGGGANDVSVDIVLEQDNKLFFHAAGDNHEEMSPVVVDMRPIMGQRVYLRVVDDHSFSWGHINFDDFKFYAEKPKVKKRVILAPDAVKHAGLQPEEAAREMTLPKGFKATLFAGEPDVNQPVGFTIDDRGRLWVAEAWTYPIRAKEGEGRDRIIIFEDTDGDGKHDKRTVFAENLNLVSGIEVGFGGVWIGAAPYLMFIPDRDGDNKPDGKPEILLDGWAWQDTHETLNAFNWGPDGWLYGCHGVFTHSRVGKPGTPDEQRVPINAGVWRYHPTKHVFEVFAEGTSNPWGIDFNDRGQAFITACVIPHLYHVIQGARYQRQAGQHFSPYVYRDIQNIGDHVHWLGDAGPHAGNEKSGSAGGGHAHCGAMIYLGGAWPEQYHDTLFMANIHGNRLNNDKLNPRGSGYVGSHLPDPVLMNDKWSRLINFRYGPDGSVYMIDWYDKQACHSNTSEIWDRTNGRIYKIAYNDQPAVKVDLSKLSDEQLVEAQLDKNDFHIRHARRLLQERGAKGAASSLRKLMGHEDVTRRLRAMWALHCVGELSRNDFDAAVADKDPYVRGWAIQLMMEDAGPVRLTGPFPPFTPGEGRGEGARESTGSRTQTPPHPNLLREGEGTGGKLATLAKSDPSPIVRLYIASALQRVPLEQRWPILEALVAHSEDAADHNLPLMYWYAAEPAVGTNPERAITLAKTSTIPLIREFIARRLTQTATAVAGSDPAKVDTKSLTALASLLSASDDNALQRDVIAGMTDGLRGWPSVPSPKGWDAVYAKLGSHADETLRARVQELSVVFGEDRAMAALRETVGNVGADPAERRKAIEALVGAKDPKVVPLLQAAVADPAVRTAALRGLATYHDPATPEAILRNYGAYDTTTKVDALNTLASRVEYAQALRSAIENNVLPKTDLTAAILRQLTALESEEIRSWVASTFGTVRTTTDEKLREIARLQKVLRGSAMKTANASNGRAIFAKTCMQCHKLFDVGGNVGPDLTGSNRADPEYLTSNIVDPGAVIGLDYLVSVIKLKDNRVLSGIVKHEDASSVTLVTESETLVIPRGDITLQKVQNGISMMPEGLMAGMSNDDFRDLAVYLRSPRQVPMQATKENINTFFNGKDLTGWSSADMSLWSVQNGEIVGKTTGLKKNNFLLSDLTAGDFRLTLKVKLVPNKANSGIQFRSEAGEGDVKGYQADVGAGWWGKLYEEHGRALLWDKPADQHVKPEEWNTYEIVAVGDRILTALNGHKCVDLDDPKGAKAGIFALQLHSGGPMEVRFKDLKLELNPKAELVTVKD